MKKRKKLLIFAIILIGIIIILPDITMYKERIKLLFDRVPSNYQKISTIDSIKDSYYEVVTLKATSYSPFLQLNDGSVIIPIVKLFRNSESNAMQNSWYKLDKDGQITDSLYYKKEKHYYETYNDYIVDTKSNTYNTWIRNGDTINYPISRMGKDKVYSTSEINNILKSQTFAFRDEENDTKKIFTLKDSTWSYYLTEKSFGNEPPSLENKFETPYSFVNYTSNTKNAVVQREYIHKEEWAKDSFWKRITHIDWGYSGSGSQEDGWNGISYFSIQMPVKKLYFKQNVFIDADSKNFKDAIQYKLYQPKNANYIILGDEENKTINIIRPKKL